MPSILTFRNWLVFSALWIGFVGFLAWQNWPRLPFDVGNDSQTAALFRAAINTHVIVHSALALAPPVLTYGLGRVVRWMRGRSK